METVLIIIYSIIAVAFLSYAIITSRSFYKQLELSRKAINKIDEEIRLCDINLELCYKRDKELKVISDYSAKTNEIYETMEIYEKLGMSVEAWSYLDTLENRLDTFRQLLDAYTEKKIFDDQHKFLMEGRYNHDTKEDRKFTKQNESLG